MKANEIVRFKNDAGQQVEITPADVTGLICPAADRKEVALFLAHCAAHRLDPFTKEAYLIKYDASKPASIVTNYNVFNARAQRFPDYRGIEDGVVFIGADGKVHHRKGSAVYSGAPLNERLLGGWAKVYREGMEPTYVELALADYSTGRSKWKTSPGLMINKCAKSAAWRTAYPTEFNGMYSAEEMDIEAETAAPAPARGAGDAPARAGGADLAPVRARFTGFREACGLSADAAMAAICAKAQKPSMDDLTPADVAEVCAWMDAKVAEAVAAEAAPAEPEAPAPAAEEADAYEIDEEELLGGF